MTRTLMLLVLAVTFLLNAGTDKIYYRLTDHAFNTSPEPGGGG